MISMRGKMLSDGGCYWPQSRSNPSSKEEELKKELKEEEFIKEKDFKVK